MAEEQIELVAKLKLDTTDAKKQLDSLGVSNAKDKAAQPKPQALPEDAKKSLKNIFEGEKGLSKLGRVLASTRGGLNGVVGSLGGLADGAGKATLALGAIAAAIGVIVKLFQGTDTIELIKEKLTQTFDKLREVMGPLLSRLGDLIVVILDIVQEVLPLLQPVIDGLAEAVKVLTSALELLKPITNFISELFTMIYDGVKRLIKTLSFGMIELGSYGSTQATVRKGYSSSLDTWATSGEETVNLLDSIDKNVSSIYGEMRQENPFVADNIEELTSWQNQLRLMFSNFGNVVSNAAKNVWEGVKSPFVKVGNWFKNLKFWDSGGTLDIGAQVWAMNEKGNPEFMFNAGGHDTVINAGILEDAMYSAVKRAESEQKARDITVRADGSQAGARELVRWILPALKLEWR